MEHPNELRRRARLFRRAASHPTEGGRSADRLLFVLADWLERDADIADRRGEAEPEKRES
jgi:hypothetical protein